MMKTRRWWTMISLGAAMMTAGCLFLGGATPGITNHTPIPIQSAPEEINLPECPLEGGVRMCAAGSMPAGLGCSRVRPAGDLLAGLSPNLPLLVCPSGAPGVPLPDPDEYLYRDGCLVSYAIHYLIRRGGELELIKNRADLQRVYAPIESEAEALSYTLAATGYGVRYGLTADRSLRYFVDELQDTFVRADAQGYLARLYDYKACGCGPHPTSAVDLLVSPSGEIKEIQRIKVFEDPTEDSLCVD